MPARIETATAELERALDALDAPGGLAGLLAAAASCEQALAAHLASNPGSAAGLEQLMQMDARGRAAIARLRAARDRAVREIAAARLLLESLRAHRPVAAPRIDCRG
jgi:hypothetical protein